MDQVFFALSDTIRRRILEALDEEPNSCLSLRPVRISLQAVSRHIQVWCARGLVNQDAPAASADAVWSLAQYFLRCGLDQSLQQILAGTIRMLAAALQEIEDGIRPSKPRPLIGKDERRKSPEDSLGTVESFT